MPTDRPRKRCELILAQARQGIARDGHRAGIGTLQPAKDHQQGRLAGPGRSDDPDGLAARNLERNTLEDMDAGRAGPQTQVNVVECDCWFSQIGPPLVVIFD